MHPASQPKNRSDDWGSRASYNPGSATRSSFAVDTAYAEGARGGALAKQTLQASGADGPSECGMGRGAGRDGGGAEAFHPSRAPASGRAAQGT